MSEGVKIALTAAFTLIGGVVLFVVGKAIEVLVVIPLQRYKEQAQLALERVDFYSNQLTNYFSDEPDEAERVRMRELSFELRAVATQLKAKYVVISWRRLLVKAKVIPSRADLDRAFGNLILLSNNLPRASREKGRTVEQSPINVNSKAIEQIQSVLGA